MENKNISKVMSKLGGEQVLYTQSFRSILCKMIIDIEDDELIIENAIESFKHIVKELKCLLKSNRYSIERLSEELAITQVFIDILNIRLSQVTDDNLYGMNYGNVNYTLYQLIEKYTEKDMSKDILESYKELGIENMSELLEYENL